MKRTPPGGRKDGEGTENGKRQSAYLEAARVRLRGRHRQQRVRRRGRHARRSPAAGHGLSARKAHATAILVILPVSLFSFILYAVRGIYDFSVLVPTALGVTLGGFLGARLLGRIPGRAVGVAFALLQAFAGLWLIFFV